MSTSTFRGGSAVPLLLLLATLTQANSGRTQDQDMGTLLEMKYHAWVESLPQTRSFSSVFDRDANYDRNPAFQEIVGLGLSAVPHIMNKLEKGEAWGLEYALGRITKWTFHYGKRVESPGRYVLFIEEYPDMQHSPDPPMARDVCLRWWRGGRRETPERFAKLYAEWKTLKSEGKEDEAQQKYQRIKDLGIDALPLIVEQLRAGNMDLMPVMSYLTDGQCPTTDRQQCVQWWDANRDKWTLPLPEAVKCAPSPESAPAPAEQPSGTP